MKKMRVEELYIFLAIAMTALFPIYFLASISALTEIMFAFVLILAIYLFYCKRWLGSVLAVSLLPLIRQEGLLFLFIWSLFVIKNKKIKYLVFIFLPTILWVFLNWFILQHSFVDTFFYIFKLNSRPPDNSAASISGIKYIYSIIYHPIFILSSLGLLFLRDKKYNFIRTCLVFYIAMLAVCEMKLFTQYGVFSRETRYLLCIVPLLSIFSVGIVKSIVDKFPGKRVLICLIIILGLIFSGVIYIRHIQKDPLVLSNSFTERQETELMKASEWLKGYLADENIDRVYIFGKDLTTTPILRLWMNMCSKVLFYGIIDVIPGQGFKVLDLISFKHAIKANGVLVSLGKEDSYLMAVKKEGWSLLKEFPAIFLYLYKKLP